MTSPPPETLVSFAQGQTAGSGEVVHQQETAESVWAVVVDRTPFHPVDHTWPDQPGDTGTLDGLRVTSTVMGAMSENGVLLIGGEIPVKRGEPGWNWYVVHLLDAGVSPNAAVGAEVALAVDQARRQALSKAHTACHLAALAMNSAFSQLWTKPARNDSLGHPDFDQIAMNSSSIDEAGSSDVYRLGKSLRKKGFAAPRLPEQLGELQFVAEETLRRWIDTDASVVVEDNGDQRITAHRHWICRLPVGIGSIPCGGTHVASLAAIEGATIDYRLSLDGGQLVVRTTP